MAIKKVTKDYGLREHEVERFTVETAEEQDKYTAAMMRMKSPDQVRKGNADHIQKVLADAGTDAHDFYLKTKLGEQAAYVTMAEWLRTYEMMQSTRATIEGAGGDPEDIALLIQLAEKLGQLQERIWWRHGVDPATGVKRESLAVSGRKSRRALPKARPAIDAHNAEVKAEADLWKRTVCRMAREIWEKPARTPLSAVAVADIVRRKWPVSLGEKKGNSTIRQAMREGGLKKPDRA